MKQSEERRSYQRTPGFPFLRFFGEKLFDLCLALARFAGFAQDDMVDIAAGIVLAVEIVCLLGCFVFVGLGARWYWLTHFETAPGPVVTKTMPKPNPTAANVHTVDTGWIDKLPRLTPSQAMSLRTKADVTLLVIVDSSGHVQYAANRKTNISGQWSCSDSPSLASNITAIQSNGKGSVGLSVNNGDIVINTDEAFVERNNPTEVYMVNDSGQICEANAFTDNAVVPITTSVPDPGLPVNKELTLPN